MAAIEAVHDAEYLQFLKTAAQEWSEDKSRSTEVVPHIHPVRYGRGKPTSLMGRAGYYMNGTNCPIGADTFSAAYASAQTAIAGATLILEGERAVYALCRPPGHHAHADMAGGFCYLNNVAIAAQVLTEGFAAPVAILDIDVHHGNGTQEIFYRRSDVFCASIHADPTSCYPFYQGYADERGEGDGLGWNLNVPLPKGSGNVEVLRAVGSICDRARELHCAAIVVALGFDGHEEDPIGQFRISTPGFEAIARCIERTDLPVLLVQEGGYDSGRLGSYLGAFLQPFIQASV